MTVCSNCGTEFDGDRCPNCGAPRSERVPPETGGDGTASAPVTEAELDEAVDAASDREGEYDGHVPGTNIGFRLSVGGAAATLFAVTLFVFGAVFVRYGGRLSVLVIVAAGLLSLPAFRRLVHRRYEWYPRRRYRVVLVAFLVLFGFVLAPPMERFEEPADELIIDDSDVPDDWTLAERTGNDTRATATFEHEESGAVMRITVDRYDTVEAASDAAVAAEREEGISLSAPITGPSYTSVTQYTDDASNVTIARELNVVAVVELRPPADLDFDDRDAASELFEAFSGAEPQPA